MRSASMIASVMECVTRTTVAPEAIHSRSSSLFMRVRVSASSAPKGSSMSRSWGSSANARAIETRCCMPPESSRGQLLVKFSRPTRLHRSRAVSIRVALGCFLRRSGRATFSSTVIQGIRLACWKTKPVVVSPASTGVRSSEPDVWS
ncbi:hypothetical protein R2601_02388 [Salipiger bermudensis HTCC2601]|uniref:Uncharacterized protein n=1 Tax=Salipiger bermudensis (strain DSM 26914 / JCM 13377 / KCTC 12554 / HTCC2601) TaxID=314265 RepID=Q0FX18_SALBH|nr:hypothetical protein R2601_02388 [Salipiger bermudensis HTCC2601]